MSPYVPSGVSPLPWREDEDDAQLLADDHDEEGESWEVVVADFDVHLDLPTRLANRTYTAKAATLFPEVAGHLEQALRLLENMDIPEDMGGMPGEAEHHVAKFEEAARALLEKARAGK